MLQKIICATLALMMAVWSPAVLYAGGPFCRTSRVVCNPQVVHRAQVVHHAPAIRHDVVQKFNVVEHVDVLQKRVEFDAEYFLGYDGYYDVVNELQAQEYAKDKDIILKQTEQVDKLIGLLEQVLKDKQSNPAPADPAPKPEEKPKPKSKPDKPAPKPEQPPEPKPVDPGLEPKVGDLELNSKVYRIFSESCASCHGPTSAKAGLQLVGQDEDGTKWLSNSTLENRVLVYDHTAGIKLKERGKKLMPLGGPALPDEEVETLRLWMIAKAEEIKKQNKE